MSMYETADDMQEELTQEEWQEIQDSMPDRSASNIQRLFIWLVQLLIIVAIFSPAIVFYYAGFQAGIIAGIVVFLIILVQF